MLQTFNYSKFAQKNSGAVLNFFVLPQLITHTNLINQNLMRIVKYITREFVIYPYPIEEVVSLKYCISNFNPEF